MDFPFYIKDLTHPLSNNIPSWHGNCGFTHRTIADYLDFNEKVKFRVQQLIMEAGIGTHMDAPAHCVQGGKCIDELNINDLLAPCVKIDVSAQCSEKLLITTEDIILFEKKYGLIAPNSFVIIHTGWDKFWGEPSKYRNNLIFPSISEQAAALLLVRDIVGLGIDTLSPDTPESGYPVHQQLLSAGKYIVENVANAQDLPPRGSFSLALPIKIEGATEAPMRLVGLVPR